MPAYYLIQTIAIERACNPDYQTLTFAEKIDAWLPIVSHSLPSCLSSNDNVENTLCCIINDFFIAYAAMVEREVQTGVNLNIQGEIAANFNLKYSTLRMEVDGLFTHRPAIICENFQDILKRTIKQETVTDESTQSETPAYWSTFKWLDQDGEPLDKQFKYAALDPSSRAYAYNVVPIFEGPSGIETWRIDASSKIATSVYVGNFVLDAGDRNYKTLVKRPILYSEFDWTKDGESLRPELKWAAVDRSGKLYAYEYKPDEHDTGYDTVKGKSLYIGIANLQGIAWEDSITRRSAVLPVTGLTKRGFFDFSWETVDGKPLPVMWQHATYDEAYGLRVYAAKPKVSEIDGLWHPNVKDRRFLQIPGYTFNGLCDDAYLDRPEVIPVMDYSDFDWTNPSTGEPIRSKFKYAAVDADGCLYVYTNIPSADSTVWTDYSDVPQADSMDICYVNLRVLDWKASLKTRPVPKRKSTKEV